MKFIRKLFVVTLLLIFTVLAANAMPTVTLASNGVVAYQAGNDVTGLIIINTSDSWNSTDELCFLAFETARTNANYRVFFTVESVDIKDLHLITANDATGFTVANIEQGFLPNKSYGFSYLVSSY